MLENMTVEEQTSFLDFKKRLDETNKLNESAMTDSASQYSQSQRSNQEETKRFIIQVGTSTKQSESTLLH